MEEITTNIKVIDRDGNLYLELPLEMELLTKLHNEIRQLSEEEQLRYELSIGRNIKAENGQNFGEKFVNFCERKGIESMRFIKEHADYEKARMKRKYHPEKLTEEDKKILKKFDNNPIPIIKEVDKAFEEAGLITPESKNNVSDSQILHEKAIEEGESIILKNAKSDFLKDKHKEELKRKDCEITKLLHEIETLNKEKEKLAFELKCYKNDNSELKEKLENVKELIS